MLVVENVYYCWAICSTILSLGHLIEESFHPLFTGTCLQLLSKNNVLFNTSYIGHCWSLIRTPHASNGISKSPIHSAQAWHERLCHASTRVVRDFLTRFFPSSSKIDWMNFFCKQCAHSKSLKEKKTPMMRTHLGNPLDLLVSNVAGPFPADPAGNRFLLTLCDHVSTFILTSLLKYWKDVLSCIFKWVKFLYGHVGRYPTQLRTDNAGEYSAALEANLWSMGAEWVPAYCCVTNIHNLLPKIRTAPMTPMEKLFGIQPNPSQIYPLGACTIVQVPSEKQDKLEERGRECILLTLPKSGHGWIFYDPRTKHIFQSSSAIFVDYQCLPVPVAKKKSGLPLILNHLKLGKVPTDAIAKKECAVISTLHQPSNLLIAKTIWTAFASGYKSEWQLAAEDKMRAFEQHDVWTPISPTKGMKVLGGKWVFDVK
ncbi:hypothetical protein O181_011414 [Austropuccinia psidii MF-1]|uniref:Retroviral polymerase SH3-like domain-containing protein n=1 Tax=Austropuccinia psidii MF-1 TaxID=1389203 RepID=A0A9Q3GLU5_9BASI|nr:hypothetical protein [Austropuccinia psidii MF-1]